MTDADRIGARTRLAGVLAGVFMLLAILLVAPLLDHTPIAALAATLLVIAWDLVDAKRGRAMLAHLAAMTARFRAGLVELGFEILPGRHPIVPLMVRESARTAKLVARLKARHILATAISYPVVPKGEEEIRFQVSADHTEADIDQVLAALADVPE